MPAASSESRESLQRQAGEVSSRCLELAEAGSWTAALEQHDLLLSSVAQLASLHHEGATQYWADFSAVHAQVTAALHKLVLASEGEALASVERVALAWQMAQRLERAQGFPIAPPPWLAVLEEQMVRRGAQQALDILKTPSSADLATGRHALGLLDRLSALLPEPPAWVEIQRAQLLESQIQALAEADLSEDPNQTLILLEQLAALPLEGDQRVAMDEVLGRARLALELLDPALIEAQKPSPAPNHSPEHPLEPPRATDLPVHEPVHEQPESGVARLVLVADADQPSSLQFAFQPLLEAEFNAIDEALDDFIWHLPKGSCAEPALQGLQTALAPAWQNGLALPPAAFERLAYLAAGWQRRMRERLAPLPILDWTAGPIVELDSTELSVLIPLLQQSAALQSVLAALRQEHQNHHFWSDRVESPWMQCPAPLEALRRFHVENGYVASTADPLAALQGWGVTAIRALMESDVWTDDAACLGLWLAVAQELVQQGFAPLPLNGAPASTRQLLTSLAGQEVVFVGDQADHLQREHHSGRCCPGGAFGLRTLAMPASRWPSRPFGGFQACLDGLVGQLEGLYRERPFAVLLAECGAYRLPLMHCMHQRYGLAVIGTSRPTASWLTDQGAEG